ncbi:MAG: hypothetical protein HY531_02400 [Chloroflexi bacterium]|nr:hypothetical protein [Chloroflexota bacterium]
MSRLLDRLDAVDRGATRAMGFAASAEPKPTPSMALLAWVPDLPQRDIASFAKLPVDSLILPGDLAPDVLAKKITPLDNVVWGVTMEKPARARVEAYREKRSDFFVFGIEETEVDAMEEGECARVLRIAPEMEESQLRGLEDLPVDIVLLQRPEPQGPLRLAHLLVISNVRAMTSRYLLLEWSGELTSRDLEYLRDAGVDGIVANVETMAPSTFAALHEKMSSLPRRRPRGEQRPLAVLPRTGGPASVRPQRREDEDEDEDEP